MVHKNARIGSGTVIWFRELSNIGDCVIGASCIIHSHVWIGNGVRIGNRVKIQAFTFIPTGVTIEDDVFIGPHVCFTNDKHPPSQGKHWHETTIRQGAVIGAGAVILPGLDIAGHIGAGAVVTKNVPYGLLVVGNPAKAFGAVDRK